MVNRGLGSPKIITQRGEYGLTCFKKIRMLVCMICRIVCLFFKQETSASFIPLNPEWILPLCCCNSNANGQVSLDETVVYRAFLVD